MALKNIFLLVFSILYGVSFSQHTVEFEKYASQITHKEIKNVVLKYKNGSVKWKGKEKVYEFGEYEYHLRFGKWMEYYKNGKLKSEVEYDNFQNVLEGKLYDKYGDVLYERKAIKIHSTAKNINEFIYWEGYHEILTFEKWYAYSLKSDKTYLRKEGMVLNNKDNIGVWKKFNREGKVIKEKEF